jgi:hypothetical protein
MRTHLGIFLVPMTGMCFSERVSKRNRWCVSSFAGWVVWKAFFPIHPRVCENTRKCDGAKMIPLHADRWSRRLTAYPLHGDLDPHSNVYSRSRQMYVEYVAHGNKCSMHDLRRGIGVTYLDAMRKAAGSLKIQSFCSLFSMTLWEDSRYA